MADNSDQARVAYLTSHYPAVSHTFILREVEALQALGIKVRTYSIRRPPADHLRGPAEENAATQTFYVLDAAKRIWPLIKAQKRAITEPKTYLSALALAYKMRAPGLRSLLYQMFYFAEATVIADDMLAQGVSHIHSHFSSVSSNVAVLAARLAKASFSYTLHGPSELYEPYRWHLDLKTQEAKFVSCISHFARSQAMYFSNPEDWYKLKIIHCGVIPELYAPAEKAASDDTHFVYVGRLAAVKGVRVLLNAFGQALKENPALRLTIVGDGDDRATLEQLAAPLGSHVVFTGYQSQSDVAATLGTADVFVLPSFAEGLPVVLMEALAGQVPVICTQVAGVAELVESGVNGYIVPPGDGDTLRARMIALSRDPALRASMGKAGQATVQADFDVRKEAQRLAPLFTQEIGIGPPRAP